MVRVETRGEVDVTALRKDIERRYPGARIEGLEKPLIRIVGEEEKKKAEKKDKEGNFIKVV